MNPPQQLTLFPEGSRDHASLFHLPAKERELKMIATSGQKCLEQFEKLDRHTLWGKMFVALLIGMEGWYSSKCRLIWKLKATKSSRLYCQLAVSTLPTEGTESGLLLTPTTREEVQDLGKFKKRMEKYPNGTTMPNLATQVQISLLATPNARDWKGESGHPCQKDLTRDVKKLLPTPAAQDSKNSTLPPSQQDRDTIPGYLLRNGQTSQLNPRFVLEMMGFQPNHCDSAFEKIAWEIYQKKKSTKSFQKRLQDGEKKQ